MKNKLAGKPSIGLEEFEQVISSEGVKGDEARGEVIKALYEFSKLRGQDSDFIRMEDLKSAMTQVGSGTMEAGEFKKVEDAIESKGVEKNAKGDLRITSFVEKVLLLI